MFLAPLKFSEPRYFIGAVIREIFKISLVTYSFFYLLEALRQGLISNYFDLDILFLATIISGILSVCPWPGSPAEASVKSIHFYDYIVAILLAIIAGGIVYYQFKSAGGIIILLALFISIVVALSSIFLIKNIYKKNESSH